MTDEAPKRKRGRPRLPPDAVVPLEIALPRHHYDYLSFLVFKKHRLATSIKGAAEHILIRELDLMFRDGYHAKEIPEA
jgi:hypothetical protein